MTYDCPQNSDPASQNAGPISINGPQPNTQTWHKNYSGTGLYGGGATSSDPPQSGAAQVAGYGSVTCRGDIIATITWNGGPNNDLPPPAVILNEYEEADWSGQPYGDCECDLPSSISDGMVSGQSPVDEMAYTSSDGMSGYDIESQYTIVTNPPATFTVHVSPYAYGYLTQGYQPPGGGGEPQSVRTSQASGSRVYSSGGSAPLAAGAGVSYQVTATTLAINFTCPDGNNGNEVIGPIGAQKCLVGMNVTASLSITPDTPAAPSHQYTWTERGGSPFAYYSD